MNRVINLERFTFIMPIYDQTVVELNNDTRAGCL